MSEPKSCTTCREHRMFGRLHLCMLPPELLDLRDPDTGEAIEPSEGGEWIGTDCDRLRRMGSICGPHALQWSACP